MANGHPTVKRYTNEGQTLAKRLPNAIVYHAEGPTCGLCPRPPRECTTPSIAVKRRPNDC